MREEVEAETLKEQKCQIGKREKYSPSTIFVLLLWWLS
jgi:hypothetical protein